MLDLSRLALPLSDRQEAWGGGAEIPVMAYLTDGQLGISS